MLECSYISFPSKSKAASDLKDQCEQNNITVMSYGSYADTNDAENQLEHIKVISNYDFSFSIVSILELRRAGHIRFLKNQSFHPQMTV